MAKGLAIHIGLNRVDPAHYGGWDGQLVACEFDAHSMQAIAAARDFESKMLLTNQATAAAVTAALNDAASQLMAGDMLLLSYSGHGGQVPDTNGDEEDGRDETWVLYDRELVDDELYALYAKFKLGVRILVLSDSCHSGSVVRLPSYRTMPPGEMPAAEVMVDQPRFRAMPGNVADRTYRAHQTLYDEIQRNTVGAEKLVPAASIILISGCQDNQTSLDGDKNGLFTQTMLSVWQDGGFQGGYRRFHRQITRRMPPYQTPNYYKVGTPDWRFERETPFTVG